MVHAGISRKYSNKEYHCYLSDDLIHDHAISNLVLDKMLQDINHDRKGIKHLEGVYLERKFHSDNLYTIPKKPKSAFYFRESVVFPSVQLELKKGRFELANEELLMISLIIGSIESNIILRNNTCIVHLYTCIARIDVLNLVFLSLTFVLFLSCQFISETTISVLVFYQLGNKI